jgi:hypothetical protein
VNVLTTDREANHLATLVLGLVSPAVDQAVLSKIHYDRASALPIIDQLTFSITSSSRELANPIRQLIESLNPERIKIEHVDVRGSRRGVIHAYTVNVDIKHRVARPLAERLKEYGHGGQETDPAYPIDS